VSFISAKIDSKLNFWNFIWNDPYLKHDNKLFENKQCSKNKNKNQQIKLFQVAS